MRPIPLCSETTTVFFFFSFFGLFAFESRLTFEILCVNISNARRQPKNYVHLCSRRLRRLFFTLDSVIIITQAQEINFLFCIFFSGIDFMRLSFCVFYLLVGSSLQTKYLFSIKFMSNFVWCCCCCSCSVRRRLFDTIWRNAIEEEEANEGKKIYYYVCDEKQRMELNRMCACVYKWTCVCVLLCMYDESMTRVWAQCTHTYDTKQDELAAHTNTDGYTTCIRAYNCVYWLFGFFFLIFLVQDYDVLFYLVSIGLFSMHNGSESKRINDRHRYDNKH